MVEQQPRGESKDPIAVAKRNGSESGELEGTRISAIDILASMSERRIILDDLKFCDGQQASGGYGVVEVATLVRKDADTPNSGINVAVKKLKFHTRDSDGVERLLKAFINEFHILNGLSHPNIIEVLGFVEDMEKKIVWIVVPWEANGNVREFLRSGEWDIPERISLMTDVSFGLEYLHSRDPPICHGDLKSLNILVNSLYRAVIADFGSARILRKDLRPEANQQPTPHSERRDDASLVAVLSASDATLTLTGPSVSFRWASPEIMRGEDPHLASDVWALGWICWEIMTDDYPFPEIQSLAGIITTVIQGQLPLIHKDDQLSQIRELCKFMTNCWRWLPDLRPIAHQCRQVLGRMPSVVPRGEKDGHPKTRSAALVVQLGELHRLGSKYHEAWMAFNNGLAIAQSTGDEGMVGKALTAMGRLKLLRSKYDEAKEHLSQALAAFERKEDSWSQAEVLIDLGWAHICLYEYADAEDCLKQAMVISDDEWNGNITRGAQYLLGEVHRARSEFEEAEGFFLDVLDIDSDNNHDLGIATTYHALGLVYRAKENLEAAENVFNLALVTYESIGNDGGHADCLQALGGIQVTLARFEEAQQSFTRALDIYRSLGNDLGKAWVLSEIGNLQLKQSKLDEAEESYIQALDIYSSKGDTKGRASILYSLGCVHLERSSYSEAESLLTEALDLYTGVEDKLGRTNVTFILGKLRSHQGRYAEAKALINTASWMSGEIDWEHGYGMAGDLMDQVKNAESKSKSLPSSSDQDSPQEPSDDANGALPCPVTVDPSPQETSA